MKVESKPERLTREVKEVALKSGASLVGIVSSASIDSFPSHWVGYTIREYIKKTTDIMPDTKSVIVIGYHVWDDILEIALRKGDHWVYPGYFPLPLITQKIEQFLQTEGYKIATHPYLISYKRLAQLAGFGPFGKNALIINPRFGPWIRLATVLTNAELTPNKPFEQDLCGSCKNCVEACPVAALTPYKVDDSKCLVGVHLIGDDLAKHEGMLKKFEPSLTRSAHLMCMECQKTCKYGKEEHSLYDSEGEKKGSSVQYY